MISENTQKVLAELEAKQGKQKPGKKVRNQLHNIQLVCVVGASCMGKSSTMDAAIALGNDFAMVTTVTSRPRQDRDKPGDYRHHYEHSDAGLKPLLDDIHGGLVVQYALNPITKHIMATYPQDYRATHNLRDIYATSADSFRKLGFGKLMIISIIAPFEVWRQRFDDRFPPSDPLRRSRLDEAILSINWSLSQSTSEDHFWLINDGSCEAAGKKLRAIINGTLPDQDAARELAAACLKEIRAMQA